MRAFTDLLRETLRARAGESKRRMRCSRNWLSATPRRIAAASPSRACAGCGCGRRERWSRTARQRVGGLTLRRLEERGQRPKGVTIRDLYLGGPLCLIRARRQGRARLRGSRARARALTAARGSALGFHALCCGKPARRAGFAQQRPWMHSAASERRSHLKANAERCPGEAGGAQRSSRGAADGGGPIWPPANKDVRAH